VSCVSSTHPCSSGYEWKIPVEKVRCVTRGWAPHPQLTPVAVVIWNFLEKGHPEFFSLLFWWLRCWDRPLHFGDKFSLPESTMASFWTNRFLGDFNWPCSWLLRSSLTCRALLFGLDGPREENDEQCEQRWSPTSRGLFIDSSRS